MPQQSLGQPGPSLTTAERTPHAAGIGFVSEEDHSVGTHGEPIAFQKT